MYVKKPTNIPLLILVYISPLSIHSHLSPLVALSFLIQQIRQVCSRSPFEWVPALIIILLAGDYITTRSLRKVDQFSSRSTDSKKITLVYQFKAKMNTFSQVPPGFRFHPTDEELVDHYLRKKVNSRRIELDVIKDIDLYKIEPWDLQELCGLGTEDQNEWYFFSHKDKKYPTGTRTNRATTAGFWKATGRDKAIYLKHELIGMRKTLVFYKGRAPSGQKSDWIMHEYRLESDENGPPQEEGWAVCRVFKKKLTAVPRMNDHETSCWFDDQVSFMPNLNTLKENNSYQNGVSWHPCKKEPYQYYDHHPKMHYGQHYLPPPHFDVPNKFVQQSMPNSSNTINNNTMLVPFNHEHQYPLQLISSLGHNMHQLVHESIHDNNVDDQQTAVVGQGTLTADWRILDKIVTSQCSHEDHLITDENNENYLNAASELFHISCNDAGPDREASTTQSVSDSMQQDFEHQQPDNTASASTSTCPIDQWK